MAFTLPTENGFTDAGHGFAGDFLGGGGAVVQDFEDALGVLLVFDAAGANGLDPLDEVVGHGALAFDATDAGRAAADLDPFETAGIAFGSGEEFVPVVDGAIIGFAWVRPPFALWVGDHDFCFAANVGVGFGEAYGVAVRLGHFAAIEAGDAGSGSEKGRRFG